MIGVALALLRIGRGLSSGLLLLALLDPLIAPAHSAGQSAHRRARGGPGARIAGYSAAYRAERGAARGSFDDMPLRWRRLVSIEACVSEAAAWDLLGSNPVCLTAHE